MIPKGMDSTRWLGRVSYGLYLVHFIVFMTLIELLHKVAPLWAILAIGLPLGLAASHVFFRWIERPSIRLGGLLTR